MLHDFLIENREDLIARCRAKVAKRLAPAVIDSELKHGIPFFLDQLVAKLRIAGAGTATSADSEPGGAASHYEIGQTAALHGNELLLEGFTVEQVVHDYGDLCQAITELAFEQKASISTDEFGTLNLCLDNAIASAVTEYANQTDHLLGADARAVHDSQIGLLLVEISRLVTSVGLATHAMKAGSVGHAGATSALLDRSLLGLRELIARSLEDLRKGEHSS